MSESLHVVCPHCDAVNRLPADRLQAEPTCGQCKRPLFVGQPLELDGPRFRKHITRSQLPVLVDFWAPWCGPCRMMAPAYAQAAQRLEPSIRLVKLNTEEAPDLAAQFAIRSIPTLALFREGKEIARQAGAMDVSGIVAWVQAHARAG